MTNEKTSKGDFVELKFTGYANNEVFDSNIPEDLKKLHPKAKEERLLVIIGEAMVVVGLDKALENKELNKEYEVSFSYKEGFGERRRELIRTLPITAFTEQKVNPYPGLVLALDNQVVKIIAVSGARVIADFNNPLSGKEIKYKFTIVNKVADEKDRAETVFKLLFGFLPEFEITEKSVAVKLPKGLESMITPYKEKFKKLSGKELEFKEMTPEEIKKRAEEHDKEHHHHDHEHEHEGHEHHEHEEHSHKHEEEHKH
jgi:FKBP-type peptidyl-prolyl cis-trans isomerase 2